MANNSQNTADLPSYGWMRILLHWVTGLLVIASFTLVWAISKDTMPDRNLYHVWIGLTLMGLVVLRIVVRLFSWKPAAPVEIPRWQSILAHIVQGLIYLILLVQSIGGWLAVNAAGYPVNWFGLQLPILIEKNQAVREFLFGSPGVDGAEGKEGMHEILGISLAVLVGIHILAALYHRFIRRDQVVQAMLPKMLRR